jgi:hypothetical protein
MNFGTNAKMVINLVNPDQGILKGEVSLYH